MRKFISRVIIFCSFIFLFIAMVFIVYVKRDVYADFGRYKNYSWKYFFQPLGDISTKKLLYSTYRHNSFIFGSSRATSVYACYLQKKIPGSKFFHYANWNERIGGIYERLRLIDSLGYDIDNVVIYLDTDYTFENDGRCHHFDHYLLTGKNKVVYLWDHYKSFFLSPNIGKVKILCGLPVTGEIFPNWQSDPITNDCNHQCSDTVIAGYGTVEFSKAYMRKMDSLRSGGYLPNRAGKQAFREKQISGGEEQMLSGIKKILEKHASNYYVVITPLYDQLKFDASDMKIIENCFGDHVYDFSGINRFTNNIYNYPDGKHFPPYVSKAILDSVITAY